MSRQTTKWWKPCVKVLRVHQWSKNLLVFLPLLLAHAVEDIGALVSVSITFVVFCLAASVVYILNDILDLQNDRIHPRKRHRVIASGDLSTSSALRLAGLLAIIAILLVAGFLPAAVAVVLVIYLALTLLYGAVLKRIAIVDVLLLASFYTLRIIAGGQAAAVEVSEWMLLFSTFFFLSLALVKRTTELSAAGSHGADRIGGRGYRKSDLPLVEMLGISSGLVSVLVFALYVNSSEVRLIYASPRILWLMLPLLLYWIARTWVAAHRGEMDDDPVVYALQDPPSWFVLLLSVGVVLAATAL